MHNKRCRPREMAQELAGLCLNISCSMGRTVSVAITQLHRQREKAAAPHTASGGCPLKLC